MIKQREDSDVYIIVALCYFAIVIISIVAVIIAF